MNDKETIERLKTEVEALRLACNIKDIYVFEQLQDEIKVLRNVNVKIAEDNRLATKWIGRFMIYTKAINQLDDYFEYRFKAQTHEQIQKFVYQVLNKAALQLSQEHKNDNN